MVYFVLVACSKTQFPSLQVDTSPQKIRTKSNKTHKQIIKKSNGTQGGTDKPRQSYQYFVIRIYNWLKRQIETFKRTRWIERDKLKHWDRWWLQFQLEEEHRREHFFEEERERIWNQGIWMPQILDGKDLDLGPSNPNQRDPNRMPTNRFSDLPKNISDEGWKEETVK